MKLPHYLHIRNHWKHALWFNLGAILLILLGAEGICRWLEAKASSAQERIRTERVYEVIPDDLVGGRLAPDTRRLTRKYADGRLIY
ncbi:MAG TPA: hypothetical protein P5248_11970, partial [Bacteroidales bacterium]|nr:hypothetical protein [Bacteroidales bacterium]